MWQTIADKFWQLVSLDNGVKPSYNCMTHQHVEENHLLDVHFDKNCAIKTLITKLDISLSRCNYYREDDRDGRTATCKRVESNHEGQNGPVSSPGCIPKITHYSGKE